MIQVMLVPGKAGLPQSVKKIMSLHFLFPSDIQSSTLYYTDLCSCWALFLGQPTFWFEALNRWYGIHTYPLVKELH